MKPKVIVRHDVLDCYSISHHHKNNFLLRYQKKQKGMDSLREELDMTCEWIKSSTPPGTITYIVESNHNNHLKKWLNDADPKSDVENASIYHELMYLVLRSVERSGIDDPFQLYFKENYRTDSVKFVQAAEPVWINGVLISMHGDIGPNGTRGSRRNLSMIGEKSIIGHSHSPGIEKGCWQVGTSSNLALEYNLGPSGWMHTHCIIHPNGKRQLIDIIDWSWRKT